MRETANALGLSAMTILSDCGFAQQPFFGRVEALWAIDQVITDSAEGDLALHGLRCEAMACACIQNAPSGRPKSLREVLEAHLVAQGTSIDAFKTTVQRAVEGHAFAVAAANAGYFRADPAVLRQVLTTAQAARKTDREDFPDPLGVRLLKRPGQWVDAGEVTASIRADNQTWAIHRRAIQQELGIMRSMPAGIGIEGAA